MRSTPSAEVNSVMISPHPPKLRMKRRNTVSVTPAIGASTVAGAIVTPPIDRDARTATDPVATAASAVRFSIPAELSQNFFTQLFYLPQQNKAPAEARAEGRA